MNAEGVGYFSHFTSTNARVENVMIALESKMNAWELEKVKWDEYIIDISKIYEYGVDNFLAKRPEVRFNADFLFIARAILEWRNILIEHGLEEYTELQKEMNCLKQILVGDIRCINVKIMGDVSQEDKSSKEVESTFFSRIEVLKQAKEVSVKDLTIVVRVDSMMIICIVHLEAQNKRLEHVTRIMMMWKFRLEQFGVPQQKEFIEFLVVDKVWKEAGGGLPMNQELNADAGNIAGS